MERILRVSKSGAKQVQSTLWSVRSEVTQLCPTLREPMDCIPPGSSIHGIYQARVLEWSATAFSNGQLTVKQNSFGKPYFILLFGIVIFVLVSLTLSASPNNCVHFLTKILNAKDSIYVCFYKFPFFVVTYLFQIVFHGNLFLFLFIRA